MRKVRDLDAEIRALSEKQRALKARRVQQLGELVLATGADALSIEQLAGALVEAAEAKAETKEAWRRCGANFFQRAQSARRRPSKNAGKNQPGDLFAQPSRAEAGSR